MAVRSFLPGYLFPLRLLVGCVLCDSCLTSFYRIRLFGFMIPAG